MKYSLILIATVFLIGISVSDGKGEGEGEKADAAGKENGKKAAAGKEDGKKAAAGKEDKNGVKDDTSANGKEKDAKSAKGTEKNKNPPEATNDDEETEDNEETEEGDGSTDTEESAEESEEEEEAMQPPPPPPPKKKTPPKKETPKKAPPKKQPASNKGAGKKKARNVQPEEDDDDTTLSDLKDAAASMNPANLIAALQTTPIKQLKKVLPEMNKLTNMLNGTPLAPIFQSLTSLMGNSSPEIWQNVFKLFPNFLSTIIGTAGQLTAVATTAFGKTAQSIVDIADVLFNAGKDLLGTVTLLPGGQLLTPLGLALDTVHGTVTPFDNLAADIKAAGKREQKKYTRAASRSRSGLNGGSGNLFSGLGL